MIYVTAIESNGYTREFREESFTPECVIFCKNFILNMKEKAIFSVTTDQDFDYGKVPSFFMRVDGKEIAAPADLFSVEQMSDKFLMFALNMILDKDTNSGHSHFVAKY